MAEESLSVEEVERRQYLSKKVETRCATEEECTELIRILDKELRLADADQADPEVRIGMVLLRMRARLMHAELRAGLEVENRTAEPKWERRVLLENPTGYMVSKGYSATDLNVGVTELPPHSRLVLETDPTAVKEYVAVEDIRQEYHGSLKKVWDQALQVWLGRIPRHRFRTADEVKQ